MSIDGWMDKDEVVNAYSRTHLVLTRKEILTHATTWMKLEDISFSEISQSQKHTYYALYLSEVPK